MFAYRLPTVAIYDLYIHTLCIYMHIYVHIFIYAYLSILIYLNGHIGYAYA